MPRIKDAFTVSDVSKNKVYSFEDVGNGRVLPTDSQGFMMTPEEARRLAKSLLIYANEVDKKEITKNHESIMDEFRQSFTKQRPRANKSRKKIKGFVYLIKSENGYYKIGKSINPTKRHQRIGVKSPFKLDLIHVIETNDYTRLEKELHEQYEEWRNEGEWFSLSDEQASGIVKRYGDYFDYN